jgi:hypothetical protein
MFIPASARVDGAKPIGRHLLPESEVTGQEPGRRGHVVKH